MQNKDETGGKIAILPLYGLKNLRFGVIVIKIVTICDGENPIFPPRGVRFAAVLAVV